MTEARGGPQISRCQVACARRRHPDNQSKGAAQPGRMRRWGAPLRRADCGGEWHADDESTVRWAFAATTKR